MLITLQHKIARSTKTGCTCHSLDLDFFLQHQVEKCVFGDSLKRSSGLFALQTQALSFSYLLKVQRVFFFPVLLCICLPMSADLSHRQRQSRPAGSTTCLCYLRCPARARNASVGASWSVTAKQLLVSILFRTQPSGVAALAWTGTQHCGEKRAVKTRCISDANAKIFQWTMPPARLERTNQHFQVLAIPLLLLA